MSTFQYLRQHFLRKCSIVYEPGVSQMEDHEWPKVFATEMALGSTRHRGVKQPHLKIRKQSGHTVHVQVMLTRRLLPLWCLPLVGMLNFPERTSIAMPPRSDARMPLYEISGLHTFG